MTRTTHKAIGKALGALLTFGFLMHFGAYVLFFAALVLTFRICFSKRKLF